MNRQNLGLLINGIFFGIFGLLFDFYGKYVFDLNSLPPQALSLVNLFGPVMFVVGSIMAFGSVIIDFEPVKDEWNAKEEVRKYLERKEE